jgi:hypothetical protein
MSLKSNKSKKACIYTPLGLIALILIVLALAALSNLGLPQHSTIIDKLSDLDKARLSEVRHLRASLGDSTWPGWSEADIPMIVYNEKYAFLLGYPNPPPGWMKVPSLEARGDPWEVVPGDSFDSQPYYRTSITDPSKTPQSFIVKVGDKWVATFMTREYSQVAFFRDFRQELPPFLSKLVPVRLIWAFLMGNTDSYIAAMEHEAFHAFEANQATDRLNASEEMYSVMDGYPFDAMAKPWKQEMDVLLRASQAPTDTEARDLARQFIQLRVARRTALTSDQVQLERLREWEEGLAKYAELEISRQAEADQSYHPVDAMSHDNGFKHYAGQQQFWSQQLKEAGKTQGRSGDSRFYYSGNALAVVLDRLMPTWKLRAIPGGDNLDDLLRDAVK